MQGTVHLLVGAAIAVLIKNPPSMVAFAFFSHYLLDFLPHIDPETFAVKNKPYTWTQYISLIADIILVISLGVALYLLRENEINILVAAVIAILPDLLTPLEKYPYFYPLRGIHEIFHWDPNRARKWDWYIAGLIAPIIVTAIALYVIWKY